MHSLPSASGADSGGDGKELQGGERGQGSGRVSARLFGQASGNKRKARAKRLQAVCDHGLSGAVQPSGKYFLEKADLLRKGGNQRTGGVYKLFVSEKIQV